MSSCDEGVCCGRRVYAIANFGSTRSRNPPVAQSAAVTASRPTQRPTLLLRKKRSRRENPQAARVIPPPKSRVSSRGGADKKVSDGCGFGGARGGQCGRGGEEKVQAPHLKISKFKDRPACPTPNRSFPLRAPDSAQPSSLPQNTNLQKWRTKFMMVPLASISVSLPALSFSRSQ
jgi:hypothetical protein